MHTPGEFKCTPTTRNYLPTGVNSLNSAMGLLGYPMGCLIECFGEEASGKTTLALTNIAAVQQAGGTVIYMDLEHTFDPKYAKRMGVDLSSMLLLRPISVPDIMDLINTAITTMERGLIVVDSLSGLPTEALSIDINGVTIGLSRALVGTSVSVLLLNQIRTNPATGRDTTPGGNVLSNISGIRISMAKTGLIKYHDVAVGCKITASVVRNKFSPFLGEANFFIKHGTGIEE